MNAPNAVSYEELLAHLEDRLWLNKSDEDFAYLAELETEVATYSGSLRPGQAYRDLAKSNTFE